MAWAVYCVGFLANIPAIHAALDLQDELRYSFFDSLVIAAALQAGAGTSTARTLQHWQLVRGALRIVNPFLEVVHEN